MPIKNNVRRSYAKPTITHYYFSGHDITLVPENKDNQKWRVSGLGGSPIGYFATLGACERAIKAARNQIAV